MGTFDSMVVLVTGGSRGIGRGIAAAFKAAGATVYTCGRKPPETEVPGTFIAADVRDADQAGALIDEILQREGRLDTLVNNAGGAPPAEAATASPRFTESIIRLNLLAPLILSQQAYAALKASRGSIVNISSVSAIRSSPGTMAYGAAKAGLVSATLSLAQEWGPQVRVNAIIAGLIRTEAADAHYGGAEGIRRLEARLPAKRMGTPEDIAKACLFLASPDSDYVSGASLEVYGGGEPPSFLSFIEEATQRD